jgi:hypothetical protein
MTQLALDVIFRSLGQNLVPESTPGLETSVDASDPSEATILSAYTFLETVYAELGNAPRHSSRAPTPMIVRSPSSISMSLTAWNPVFPLNSSLPGTPSLPGAFLPKLKLQNSPKSVRLVRSARMAAKSSDQSAPKRSKVASSLPRAPRLPSASQPDQTRSTRAAKSPLRQFMASTTSTNQRYNAKTCNSKGEHSAGMPPPTPRRLLTRPSALPQHPDVSALNISSDPTAEYAVLISMYEVYNDRIFDLLTPPIKSAATKEYRRRPLLFKSTELSPDRKVVAGLRKIICSNLTQALLVMEAGLHERRVAGTGSNSVSSRSHGFFCIEVKKRARGSRNQYLPWGGSTLTVVDLAGSERARDAKTAGATLAEAGKINESLMYLGQCLQMQSDQANSAKVCLILLISSRR